MVDVQIRRCQVSWHAHTYRVLGDPVTRFEATVYPERGGGELARLTMTDVTEAVFVAALQALIEALPDAVTRR